MAIPNPIEDPGVVGKVKSKGIAMAKNKVFDLIGISVVLVMFFVGLGALKLIDFTFESLLNFVISFIPFYLATMVLNTNYYTKGTYKGKESDVYKAAILAYSTITSNLNGDQQMKLTDFVDWYNADALKRLQTSILRRVSISYERFATMTYDKDGKELPPLQTYSYNELLAMYNKYVATTIEHAKTAHVKKISVNILLSNVQSVDPTDLGKSEAQLRRTRLGLTGVASFISVIALSLIGFKDIMEWGWVAAFVTLFKMVYIFARSYQMFFKAYDDITVSVVNHIARKTDILKQFQSWYKENSKTVQEVNS